MLKPIITKAMIAPPAKKLYLENNDNCEDNNNGLEDKSKIHESWTEVYDKETTINLRKKHLSPSMQTFFAENPLKIIRAKYQYMYDDTEQEFLDCINNVAHVGHCHPHVVKAVSDQMSLLNTNSRYLHDNIVQLAARLSSMFPDVLSSCYFVNSGSEANDLAIILARGFTKNKHVISLERAYHGTLTSTMALSSYKFNHPNAVVKQANWAHTVSSPDRYRGRYRDDKYSMEELTELYVREVKETCELLRKRGKFPAAFIAESMQSCAGQVIYPPGYLSKVAKVIRSYGGVIIMDEVQTGFGRIGEKLWAYTLDGEDFVPDIVTIGKPMGNGFPLSAVITTQQIAETHSKGPGYFNTFGGNPASCAAGLAVLDVLQAENLPLHAQTIGNYLKKEFEKLQSKYEIIGDIRGSGLFLGIDLVTCRKSREPATTQARTILNKMKMRNIIISVDGPYENIIKIKPPMCFNKENADTLIRNLDDVFRQVTEN